MPGRKNMINEKVQSLVSNAVYNNDIILNIPLHYKYIEYMWKYHQIICQEFIKKYKGGSIKCTKKVFDNYRKYYNKYGIIRDLFNVHTTTDKDHLIIFYVKGEDNVFCSLKTDDINPTSKFIQFKIPTMSLDGGTYRLIQPDIENSLKVICCVPK